MMKSGNLFSNIKKMFIKYYAIFLLVAVALKSVSCCDSTKYIIGEGGLTWFEALEKCRSHKMVLATVTSEDDKHEISALLDKCKPEDGLNNGLWLGGHRLKNSNWVWSSNGQSMDVYEMWGPGQPANWKGTERCLEIYRDQGNWYWNDNDCEIKENRKRFICQNP